MPVLASSSNGPQPGPSRSAVSALAVVVAGCLLVSLFQGLPGAERQTPTPEPRWLSLPRPSARAFPSFAASLDSDSFHRLSCKVTRRVAVGRLCWFAERQDAATGRKPCKLCVP